MGIAAFSPLRSTPVCHSSVFLVDLGIFASIREITSLSGNGFLSIQIRIINQLSVSQCIVYRRPSLPSRKQPLVANLRFPTAPEFPRALNSNRFLYPLSQNNPYGRIKARKIGSTVRFGGQVRRSGSATEVLVANPRLLTIPEISTPLSCYGSVGLASLYCPKARKTLFDYRQSASLTIARCSPIKRGSSGCVRSMTRAEPSQNKRKRARGLISR